MAKNGELLAVVRHLPVVEALRKKADLKGRPSCPKKDNPKSPCLGTNILIAIGNELVSLSERDGKVKIHEYQRTVNTELGKKIRDSIKDANLSLA